MEGVILSHQGHDSSRFVGISQMVGCSWVRGVGWDDFLASGSRFKRIWVDLTAVSGFFDGFDRVPTGFGPSTGPLGRAR